MLWTPSLRNKNLYLYLSWEGGPLLSTFHIWLRSLKKGESVHQPRFGPEDLPRKSFGNRKDYVYTKKLYEVRIIPTLLLSLVRFLHIRVSQFFGRKFRRTN